MENTTYGFMDMAFSVKAVFNHGLDNFIHALSKTRAGKVNMVVVVVVMVAVVMVVFNQDLDIFLHALTRYYPPFNEYES